MSTSPIKIHTLKLFIDDGRVKRPLFIGSLAADLLHQIAEVPRYTDTTHHYQIASNILTTPVREWQRPLNQEKVQEISRRFDEDGEFMPNPVLLAVNKENLVDIVQVTTPSGDNTDVFELTIKKPTHDVLWILDGQHRVEGLANTKKRKSNPIPIVILFDKKKNAYQPRDFAAVFAEVSTKQTALAPLHKDWLEYVYGLGNYADLHKGGAYKSSMETVARMCSTPSFSAASATLTNHFFDKIQFNDRNPATPGSPPPAVWNEGFRFTASEYAEIIYTYYFSKASHSSLLTPSQLAEQLNLAMTELIGICKTPPNDSVLFGHGGKAGAKGRRSVQMGILVAFVSKILGDHTPAWGTIFRNLKFQQVDWDFSKWTVSTGGDAGNISKKVAREIFVQLIHDETLPGGATGKPATVVDYFKGDLAQVEVCAFDISQKTGKRIPKKGKETFEMDMGRRPTFVTTKTGKAIITIKPKTQNIGKLRIADKNNSLGKQFTAESLKRGVVMTSGNLVLDIATEHFGEYEVTSELTIVVN